MPDRETAAPTSSSTLPQRAADALNVHTPNKGYLDVQFGLGGDIWLPQNAIVAKEIEVKGTFRFHEEFGQAVDLVNQKRVDFSALLSEIYPVTDSVKAFEVTGDRSRSMKVQLSF